MYLAFSKIGFFVGFTKESTKKVGKVLGKTTRYILCVSEKDAKSMLESCINEAQLHIHPYNFIIGSVVLFKKIRTQIFIDPNTGIKKVYDDAGNVIISDSNGNEVRYFVNADSLIPDKTGTQLLNRDGHLMYYHFQRDEKDKIEECEVHIVKNGDRYKMEFPAKHTDSKDIEIAKTSRVTFTSKYSRKLARELEDSCR